MVSHTYSPDTKVCTEDMTMTLLRPFLLLVLVAFVWEMPALVQSQASAVQQGLTPEIKAKLRSGGLNIFFRHGATLHEKDPVDSDSDDPQQANCSLQRNLSRDGVVQMQSVGDAFDSLEIPVGSVRASPLCRCYDSAWHAFGRAERDRNLQLNGDTPEGDASQARPWKHIRDLGKVPPPPLTNAVFISHSRIGEIFGSDVLMEGEAVIIEPDGKGGWKLLARVTSDEWR
jgi:phosphohistidine phosphatase SixA